MRGSDADIKIGAFLSYGIDLKVFYRRSATYVEKIFKGAKLADLPQVKTGMRREALGSAKKIGGSASAIGGSASGGPATMHSA